MNRLVLAIFALSASALAAVSADLDGTKGDEVILVAALSDGTGELIVLHREAP